MSSVKPPERAGEIEFIGDWAYARRERTEDVAIGNLGEWQVFKFEKLFALCDTDCDGIVSEQDFVEVIARRYACEVGLVGDSLAQEMEGACSVFFRAVVEGAEKLQRTEWDDVAEMPGDAPSSPTSSNLRVTMHGFLLGITNMLSRDYRRDAPLPDEIAAMESLRFDIIERAQEQALQPPVSHEKGTVGSDAFKAEYTISRKWTPAWDGYDKSLREPTVDALFQQARVSLPAEAGEKESGSGLLTKAQFNAFRVRWWLSNDPWDPINCYP